MYKCHQTNHQKLKRHRIKLWITKNLKNLAIKVPNKIQPAKFSASVAESKPFNPIRVSSRNKLKKSLRDYRNCLFSVEKPIFFNHSKKSRLSHHQLHLRSQFSLALSQMITCFNRFYPCALAVKTWIQNNATKSSTKSTKQSSAYNWCLMTSLRFPRLKKIAFRKFQSLKRQANLKN